MKERYAFCVKMKVENDTAEVMLYSHIAGDKFWGDEYTPEDFDKELKDAKKNGATKLNLRVNSPGGDVFAAVAMRSMIINAEFSSVRVMIEGLCASAATLFATVPGAKVVIADGSEFMIHNPMTIAWGNANEIEKTVDHLRSMEGTFHEMYASKCGKDEEQIKQWMDEETWFTAKRAVEEGFCDELLETEKAVACVSAHELAVMCALYNNVPKDIAIAPAEDDQGAFRSPPGTPSDNKSSEVEMTVENLQKAAEAVFNNGSNENPVAGFSTVNKNKEEPNTMEIKDCTREQLLAENPALVDEIVNQAVTAERARVEEIDNLTIPGYEADAAEAKANGTSAVDFVKSIAAKAKQKGAAFMAQRTEETAPAASVAAGAAEDEDKSEEDEIQAEAKKNAELAAQMVGSSNGMF